MVIKYWSWTQFHNQNPMIEILLLVNVLKYVMRCAIWYHLHNLKIKNVHEGVLLLVKFQALVWNFTKSNTPPWVFLTFLKLYKWYQIGQSITYFTRPPLYFNMFYTKKVNEMFYRTKQIQLTTGHLTQEPMPMPIPQQSFFLHAVHNNHLKSILQGLVRLNNILRSYKNSERYSFARKFEWDFQHFQTLFLLTKYFHGVFIVNFEHISHLVWYFYC